MGAGHLVEEQSIVNKHAYQIGAVVAGGEPKLSIRIIGRCNFRCQDCSTFSRPERKGIMRLSALIKAVDILARERFHGVLNISGGEPTLHPRVSEMVSYASKRLPGATVVLFTNGHWVGRPHWRQKLRRLLAGENVLLRFSLDRQHAEGALRAANIILEQNLLKEIESSRLKKARLFFEACLEEGALPGLHFDFAFKGSEKEAREYMCDLGYVPLYLIRFQKDPAHRAKKMGYFAIDLDEKNQALVYSTLGHIYPGESLGGIENLPAALKMNRKALKTKGHV